MSIFCGDCKEILPNIEAESVDMIYLDPPFFTQKTHNLKTRDNAQNYHFEDSWESAEHYTIYMKSRIKECHRVLKKDGNIFLHCDKNASHYLRLILDEIFGSKNFRNEIIWHYKRWSSNKSALQSQHQVIYFYGKTKASKFNTLYTDYSATTNIDQILQERTRDEHGKSKYKTDSGGNIVWAKEKKGVPLGDVWEIPYLNPKAHERVGYPTQKPVLLLERIIEISTNVGDIVLDPFCGSGTTLVAAKLLNRRFVGIDISSDAVNIATSRTENPIKTTSILLEKGKNCYLTKTPTESKILASLEAIPVQRNAGIDGFLTMQQGRQIPIKIQKQEESLQEAKQKLMQAAKKRNYPYMVLIRTHNSLQNQLEWFSFSGNATIFVVDSLELSVSNWFVGLENLAKVAQM
ncbi:MAG: site-specific DNA-methyltransferase [Defluviitaleaceae bacterium]|nr:site-specific DNA-methyltransferase [Defluviitaleaceae bacterium]